MRQGGKLPVSLKYLVAMFFLIALWWESALAQDAAQRPVEKPVAKSTEKTATPEKAVNPAQIELLETKVRFESNGDSRKEVHTLVKINSELGVRQFAKLNFDNNQSFESIEIPLVHITHSSGGTADILPSAITDQPNPAVADAPAYQNVRVKSVRILGLQPGDTLEYRVVTTVSRHPLAPEFWLEHSFDRTGVVTEEHFEIDVPANRKVQLHVRTEFPNETIESESRNDARVVYRWKRRGVPVKEVADELADVVLTSLPSWNALSQTLALQFLPRAVPGDDLYAQSKELTRDANSGEEKLLMLYEFVSQKIRTIDLPLGALGYSARRLADIIASGYANPEEKAFLLAALCESAGIPAHPALVGAPDSRQKLLPSPRLFSRVVVRAGELPQVYWLDPNLEVAPFSAIQANLRGKHSFLLIPVPETQGGPEGLWSTIPSDLPFRSTQSVTVQAMLTADGKLTAKVHYSMRGDNELLLRVAFHQMPKERWKELAQLLSITDGFRGEVSSVAASDPYATRDPFTLDYEISMPRFVDWSKKIVRIPALLPQLGLPDPPAKTAAGAATSPIDLGTPLEVETKMTLQLPSGTAAHPPTGTSVQRDYATYASQYSAKGQTVAASRHIQFLFREVPAARAADYNAFLRAVQNDEAQDFTIERANPTPLGAKPAESKTPPPNKTVQNKP